jgi:hypothetical protein
VTEIEAMMRAALLSLPLLALPGLAVAQALVPCERIEGTTRPDIMPATRHEALVDGGGLRRIVLTLQNGTRSTTDLEPIGNGVSVRLLAFPDPQRPDRYRAVFNRAVAEPGGTFLVETFLRGADEPVPRANWYRLRCAAGAATK